MNHKGNWLDADNKNKESMIALSFMSFHVQVGHG